MEKYIQSPLNYTGGKFKLLPQIVPLFPKQINTFVDLFCGGGNVGCNVNCEHVIYNDIESRLVMLLETFKILDKEFTFELIDEIIQYYNLSQVSKFGYDYYKCNSSDGLGKYNKEGFKRLKEDFNHYKYKDPKYYILFYVLIVYSFNNQIRFNSKGEFNLPAGKRDFNDKMRNKLSEFIDRLKHKSCTFESVDFRQVELDELTENDLVYCDPPYLITCATYNEQDMWNEQAERDLLAFLDKLNAAHIRFALSNVLSSKGKENKILQQWINKNEYKCIHLNHSYANSSYHTKDRTSISDEVLIINY